MGSEPFLWMAGPVIAIGLLRYRADLRTRGHPTVPGVALLLAAWSMPHLVLGYAIPMFPVPRAPRQWAG